MKDYGLTIGDIGKRLETKLFSEHSQDEFERKCFKREKTLKDAINTTSRLLNQQLKLLKSNQQEVNHWKEDQLNKCSENLLGYIAELAFELDVEKIQKYCLNLRNRMFPSEFHPNIILLTQNSYYIRIELDIAWAIRDFSLEDAINASFGKFDNELFRKYLTDKIKITRDVIKSIKEIPQFLKFINIFEEAITCYKNKCYKAYNLLVMTGIEGLVRELGKVLKEFQGLKEDLNHPQYNSLSSYLRNIEWKKDIEILKQEYDLLNGDYKRGKFYSPEEKISITLKERLPFLIRRFKDDRDKILHGEINEYGTSLNSYIVSCAFIEVGETIKYYKNKYSL
jgi:hypothetical protein